MYDFIGEQLCAKGVKVLCLFCRQPRRASIRCMGLLFTIAFTRPSVRDDRVLSSLALRPVALRPKRTRSFDQALALLGGRVAL